MKRTRMSLYAAAAIGALVASGVAAAPAAQAAKSRHRIARTAPSWVSRTKAKGNAKESAQSTFRVYLAPNGGIDQLKAAVDAISTPGSATYQQYLTPAQYHASYDPTAASVKSVRSWLKDNALKVSGVGAGKRYLTVHGTNAAVEKAFGVDMKTYSHDGQTVTANSGDIAVPAALAPLVLTVTGLDTSPSTMTHNDTVGDAAADNAAKSGPEAAPPAGFRNAKPCSTSYGQVAASTQADFKTPLPKFGNKTVPYAVCGYTGPQYRSAYEGTTTLDGTGTTVAVLDAYAAPTIAKDAQTYATNHGDGGYAAGQFSQVLPSKFEHGGTGAAGCDASGWYGEETLDVEAVHAMAPGANVLYYGAVSCYDEDFADALDTIVEQNKASVVTNSWGEVEQGESTESIAAFEQAFLQGAAQGISIGFSSGDNGDELQNSGIKQADYPSSDPYVTSVGGTASGIDANGALSLNTGWGTQKYSLSADQKSWTPLGYLYGAGGGTSSLFNQPSYQKGVVPTSFGAARATPDVALDADPTTGMLIGETQTFPDGKYYSEYRIGGTSLASPLFAGVTALRQQNAGKRLGLQNAAIYKAYGSAAFSDVKGAPADAGNVRIDYANGLDASGGLLYSIRTFNQDSSLVVTKGWDEVTGVGTPTSAWLTTK